MKKVKLSMLLRTVLVAIIIAVLFRSYFFASYVVDGKSMEPTLSDGNLLIVNKIIYGMKDIDRFDVIVFHANEQEDYVKRVIGEPGDSIAYHDDQLFVNGKKIDESYLEPFRTNDGSLLTEDFTLEELTGEQQVPAGKLFVLGDNRKRSLDSRYFGFIDMDSVVGKVDVRYWPFTDLGFSFVD